jgi:predicted hydrocarbon binding protein
MILDWRKELSRDGSRITLSGLHMAMHCHHYSINLQKMLEDTMGDAGIGLIFRSAEEATYEGARTLMEQFNPIRTVKSKLELMATLYQNCGLGIIHFQKMTPRGGQVIGISSHQVIGWLAKHGRRDTPGCHFTRGWIAGVMAVVYGRPLGNYRVEEVECKIVGDPQCTFQVRE